MLRKPTTFFALAAIMLLAAGGYYAVMSTTDRRPAMELARKSVSRISDEVDRATAVAQRILADPSQIWNSPEYPFYIMEGNTIVAWSSNFYEPEVAWFRDSEKERFVRSLRGDFMAKSWKMANDRTLLVLVPLVQRYRITNRYLGPVYNPAIFPKLKTINIGPPELNRPFILTFNEDEFSPDWVYFWCFSLAVLSVLIAVGMIVAQLHRRRRYGRALLFMLISAVLLRSAMILGNFPEAWIPLPSFDPATYASSAFNPTIFDLFVNALVVVVLIAYLLLVYSRLPMLREKLMKNTNTRFGLAVVSLTLAFFGFLFPFLFFETIFHNSSITLDWTQSLFVDGPRVMAFLSVIAGSAASFMFCHVLVRYATALIGERRMVAFAMVVLAGAAIFVAYYLVADRDYLITTLVATGYFILLYATGWTKGLQRTSYLTFLYLTLGVIAFALQASFSNERYTNERTAGFQYRFGLNFLVERDVLGEYLLNEGVARIRQDPFIQSGISNPFVSKGSLRQKIRQLHLSSYFNRYDVQIHMFSSTGEPVDNLSSSDLAGFVRQFKEDTGQTVYKGVYFINRTGSGSAKRYVAVVPIVRQDRTMGYVTLELSLKKIVPESVFPELLVDNRFAENFKATDYSYAVFQNDTLVSTFGSFNYEAKSGSDWLRDVPEGPTGRVMDGYRHIMISGETGYAVVITAGVYPSFYLASNIAFWSLLGIALIALTLLIGILVDIRQVLVLNYATRIQMYVFLAFIIPLVAVSITTLYWTSLSAEDDLKIEFADKTRKISEQVTPFLAQYLNDGGDIGPLQQSLIETARLSGVDATIYSKSGHLVATNQVQIFDNLILSNLINPQVMRKLSLRENAFIMEEVIGKLQYNNSYRLLRSESTGEILGVLSIPFFNSGDSLDRSRIIILSNTQIVFMIIFVLFTVLSFTVTRWFTHPLRMITRSLSNTTLKEVNKPLNWESNDEIGWMVQEYNRMVRNLEKSKIELARSQKESAWREMAQQVAHEIKNPLTPMKLTLQQLEMLMKGQEFPKERAESAVKNLLVQLEILNEIATSFSSFARMPAPILHRTDIGKLVEKAALLHANHPSGKVILHPLPPDVIVMGDDQLLSRIFSNLILNGLQSASDRPVQVEVSMEVKDGEVIVRFSDNGSGIDESLRDKVFMPHFTTKKSGSGLGLAISRQGVEQSGGRIWFETSERGTDFFVALPVV